MRRTAWIFAILLALTVTPALAQSWPQVAAVCDHAGTRVTATPARELEPFRNWRVAIADCGNDITARFYTDGDQIRVAFEYQKSSLWEGAPARDYTAAVILDGVEVARHEIVQQVPYTRWSWRLKEPAVIHERRELVAAGMLPPLGDGIRGRQFGMGGTYEPLGLAGFTPAMGMAGGRQDFGVVPSATGEYIATGNTDARRVMFDQADSLGSWPFVARDPDTGAALRFDGDLIDAVYGVASGSDQEARKIKYSLRKVTNRQGKIIDQKPDHAHLPSFSYVPWMLTGDPYYLEGLQFEMVWVVGRSQNVGVSEFPRVVHNEQMRSLGWAVRTTIQAALGVPDDVPSWLVPGSYYDWLSAGNAETWKKVYVDGDRSVIRWGGGQDVAAFGQWSGSLERKDAAFQIKNSSYRRWMIDFFTLSVAHGVLGGLDEWRPLLDWQMKAAVDGGRWLRGRIGLFSAKPESSINPGQFPVDWADFAARQGNLPELTHESGTDKPVGYNYYWQYYHSTIRVAEHFNVPGAAEIAAWLESARLADTYAGEFQFEFELKPPPDVAPGLPLSDFLQKPE